MKTLKKNSELIISIVNEKQKARNLLANKLQMESLVVREESMKVLKEFEMVEDIDKE